MATIAGIILFSAGLYAMFRYWKSLDKKRKYFDESDIYDNEEHY